MTLRKDTSKSSGLEALIKQSSSLFLQPSHEETKTKYRRFREHYRLFPDQFIADCIDFGDRNPAPYQLEIAQKLVTKRRVSVRGPHGLGKTAMSSWLIWWFALTSDNDYEWKIPTTASAWRQLEKFLWPEVKKWSTRIKWDIVGREPPTANELLTLSLKLNTGEAFALASSDSNLIEGAHAERIMYVFDESKAIPDQTWDSAEGAMSVGEAYWLSISTPGHPSGRFYSIQKRDTGYEDWWVRHVKQYEAIDAGQMSQEWADARARQWGSKSAVYINRVLGEFAATESDSVIPLEWIEQSNSLWQQFMDDEKPVIGPPSRLGVDVARFGNDKTIFAWKHGSIIVKLEPFQKEDTVAVAEKIKVRMAMHPQMECSIDANGVGAGVYDMVKRQYNDRVFPFMSSGSTIMTDESELLTFFDVRSAAWWYMRELLSPHVRGGCEILLPPDDMLIGDLVAPTWKEMRKGVIKVESKDEIKKRLQRSTDAADAVIIAAWDETQSGADYR